MPLVGDAPAVVRIFYPTAVTLPDGTALRLAKVVLTHAGVYVFTSGRGGVIETYSAPREDSPIPSPMGTRAGTTLSILTADGTVDVRVLGGCGCSTVALKTYRPFPTGPARMT